MSEHPLFKMSFSGVYSCLVEKAEKKGRSKDEVDQIIDWMMGYDSAGLEGLAKAEATYGDFIRQAPALNPNREKITGVVCGVRVENVEDPMMREVRYLDKMVDELAKGKAMDKILRA